MFRCRFLFAAAVLSLFASPALFADSYLYDYLMNVNGTTYCPSSTTVTGCTSTGGFAAVPGLNSSLFNTNNSSSNPGQGTLSLKFKPGPAGNYTVSTWIWDSVSDPVYNEYGAVHGTASSGQNWQIDIPDYESDSNFTGTIIANTKANTLDDTNHITGTSDNYLLQCTGSTCNDDTSMAMGFTFHLNANQTELVMFTIGKTQPGGFSLEQIHPVDGNNASASSLFMSGSAAVCTSPDCGVIPPPKTPEPSSLALTIAALAALGFGCSRRFFKK